MGLKIRYLLLEAIEGKKNKNSELKQVQHFIRGHIVEIPIKYVLSVKEVESQHKKIKKGGDLWKLLQTYKLSRCYEVSLDNRSVGLVSETGHTSQFLCRVQNNSVLKILGHYAEEHKIISEDEFLKLIHAA